MKKALVALKVYEGRNVGDIVNVVPTDWDGYLLNSGITVGVEFDETQIDEMFMMAVLIPESGEVPEHYEIQENASAKSLYESQANLRAAKSAMESAMSFGYNLVKEFGAENILLGITQANMTKTVRTNLSEVLLALQTGSLHDAIDEIRAIPVENKDATFITDARLLVFLNKIESFLGVDISSSL